MNHNNLQRVLGQFKYLRCGIGGIATFQQDLLTNELIYELDSLDFDVSNDLVNWVHLLGPCCRHGLSNVFQNDAR